MRPTHAATPGLRAFLRIPRLGSPVWLHVGTAVAVSPMSLFIVGAAKGGMRAVDTGDDAGEPHDRVTASGGDGVLIGWG
jgi:hypothetical protein